MFITDFLPVNVNAVINILNLNYINLSDYILLEPTDQMRCATSLQLIIGFCFVRFAGKSYILTTTILLYSTSNM